jgi:3-deoxy-D-manno-octulosonic-acid transferase
MHLLYDIGMWVYGLLLKFFSLFNQKARLFVQGRRKQSKNISRLINSTQQHVWFHFASLGEFEQGRPVLEKLIERFPAKKIIVTFFSPSGYEIRKDYALAAAVFYLPLDTRENARRFIEAINPEFAVFTKYEYWYHYFRELHKREVPLYIISGIFRPGQVFFSWYGGLHRQMLGFVSHFFLQNQQSLDLLKSIGHSNASLSGDTRFDRVAVNAATSKKLDLVDAFCGQASTLVAGSTWPQDEQFLPMLTQKYADWKFIIAPHEIHQDHIQEIMKLFPSAITYSQCLQGNYTDNVLKEKQVLIIDNIGMLSSLYQYGKIAYIGGGFGAGIHNTLEAAAFGLPVIFGPKYLKFQEATDLIAIGAAKSISSVEQLLQAFEHFSRDEKAGVAAKSYVVQKTGATEKILELITALPSPQAHR